MKQKQPTKEQTKQIELQGDIQEAITRYLNRNNLTITNCRHDVVDALLATAALIATFEKEWQQPQETDAEYQERISPMVNRILAGLKTAAMHTSFNCQSFFIR